MKKIITLLVAFACVFGLFVSTAHAREDLNEVFENEIAGLDHFYELNVEYMIARLSRELYSWEKVEELEGEPLTVSAAEYEAKLNEIFAVDAATLQQIRDMTGYDAINQTYQVEYLGGFGGTLPPRQYLGYVENEDGTYYVFYQNITYLFLPDDVETPDEWGPVEYEGVIYEAGPDGYYAIGSYDDYGRRYHVEYNDGVVRYLACVNYTAEDLPQVFHPLPPEIDYDVPADGSVVIEGNDSFDDDTVVKAETVISGSLFEQVQSTMEQVAEKYVAFEITATSNDVLVQPTGKVTVTFEIPQDYSTTVSVYYMAEDGTLEALQTTVDADARTATVELEHFSTYILADDSTKPEVEPEPEPEPETKPEPEPETKPEPDPTVPNPTESKPAQDAGGDAAEPENDYTVWIVIAAVVILGGVCVFFVLRKRAVK